MIFAFASNDNQIYCSKFLLYSNDSSTNILKGLWQNWANCRTANLSLPVSGQSGLRKDDSGYGDLHCIRFLALLQRKVTQYLISGSMRGMDFAQKNFNEYVFLSISFKGLTLIMKMLGQSNE